MVSGKTSLGLQPGENNPGTKLVHVVLLQVLELSRVAVDPSSLCSSFLWLITPIHLQVILGQFLAFSLGLEQTKHMNIEYLQCHFGIRRIHFNPLKANCSEHRASRLQGKKDPHTERPVHPWVQFLLQRCTADAKSGADTSFQER